MNGIRWFGSCIVLGGIALLGGCVAVPGGYGYGAPVYSQPYAQPYAEPYYADPGPVVIGPPSVYIEGGGYYRRPNNYYYGRPGYPGYYGRPGYYGPRPGVGPHPGPGAGPRPGFAGPGVPGTPRPPRILPGGGAQGDGP